MIYLLRHGEAEDSASDDAARRLTEKGERQALAAGIAMMTSPMAPNLRMRTLGWGMKNFAALRI